MELKIKIESPHSEDCQKQHALWHKPTEMFMTSEDLELDSDGNKTNDIYRWRVFECADIVNGCPCRVLVRLDSIEAAVSEAMADTELQQPRPRKGCTFALHPNSSLSLG